MGLGQYVHFWLDPKTNQKDQEPIMLPPTGLRTPAIGSGQRSVLHYLQNPLPGGLGVF